jgi:hypothetical protein
MAIKISSSLKKKLPETERENIEESLWAKSGGHCYLCEGEINRSSDDVEADHDVPESAGGLTSIDNLNLAHSACNKAKRDSKTVDVRPYLKLKAQAKGKRLKYDGFLPFLGINPKPIVFEMTKKNTIRFELPNGVVSEVPVFEETNSVDTFKYAFLSLPRNAIFNDEACQPRNMRLEHAWQIYFDLQSNVLHEPPSCRLEKNLEGQPVKLLMFDGQHKTLASWMMGRDEVTAKVYLNLTDARANMLVNSIQAKIKKLPLSPFELAGKMSDEWENKFKEFEAEVGSNAVSEIGFLEWLPTQSRTRGKDALRSALVQNILGEEGLRIKKHIKRAGYAGEIEITEQALRSKLIERLLSMEPRSEIGSDAQALREVEAENILEYLNWFNDAVLEPKDEAHGFTPMELNRAKRMTYQAGLAYSADLVRQLWFHIAARDKTKAAMVDEFTEVDKKKFHDGLEKLIKHPAWTANLEENDKLKKFKTALEKNQNIAEASEALGLDLPYLVFGPTTNQYLQAWS